MSILLLKRSLLRALPSLPLTSLLYKDSEKQYCGVKATE